jgi:hypothetical protein
VPEPLDPEPLVPEPLPLIDEILMNSSRLIWPSEFLSRLVNRVDGSPVKPDKLPEEPEPDVPNPELPELPEPEVPDPELPDPEEPEDEEPLVPELPEPEVDCATAVTAKARTADKVVMVSFIYAYLVRC